jgi:hypothetical protein
MSSSTGYQGNRSFEHLEKRPSPGWRDQPDYAPSEAETLLRRFNPALVGFGLVDLRSGETFTTEELPDSPGRYLPPERPEGFK